MEVKRDKADLRNAALTIYKSAFLLGAMSG
jgi:hypothetical protein